MPRRGRWLKVALLGALAALLLGRWVAVRLANALWADALGVSAAHTAIANLRLLLGTLAFLAAAVWCIGNLYLVYRSIGSVQVPRRLGNIEIVETIPRRYLLYGAIGVGLILAYAMSHGAGEWWLDRALIEANVAVGVRDPVLDRDVAFYLFRLPWLRGLHGFVTVLAGIMLAIVIFLYVAVGAIRWSRRRLTVNELARTHVGAALAIFALTLFWGYRLEPLELVAGIHNVPFDTILTSVRIPVARVLGGVALVVTATSAIWIWLGHNALIGIAWGALGLGSFVGHYVAPAMAAAGRAPDERIDPALAAAAVAFVRDAYALGGDTTVAPLAVPDPAFTERRGDELRRLPLWDAFAVAFNLNRAAQPRASDRFFDATLSLAEGPRGPEPLYVAVREVDLEAAEQNDRGMTWERRHGRPYAHAAGAVAIHATRVSDDGLPVFVRDLRRPDSTTPHPVDLSLAVPDVWFSPAAADFAVVSADEGPFAGVAAAGILRRIVLAWTLQSPSIVTSASVRSNSMILSDRAVGRRLGRYAPFARFGAAYPVVADGALVWVAAGYVWSEAYPLAATVQWRGRRVRYLRAGLVGVVDARSGATTVYLVPDADPLSRAWADLASDIVRPHEELPEAVRAGLRYPAELFREQLGLLRRTDWRPGIQGGAARAPEPYWWVGTALSDSTLRVRLRAVIEVQVEPKVAAIVDGSVVDGAATLRVIAYPEPLTLTGPSALAQEFAGDVAQEAAIPGPLKVAPFADGAIAVQAFYAEPAGSGGAPRVAEVAAGWRGAVGRGPTLAVALRRIRVTLADTLSAVPPGDTWAQARRWFARLDAARAAGDWAAFGEAYAALKRLLGAVRDTLP